MASIDTPHDPAALAPRSSLGPVGIWALTLTFYSVAVLAFGYTGHDDSHITYFVVDALAQGRGLINYNGDPIEQSSTVVFPVLLAGVARLTGLPAAAFGPFASIGFMALAITWTWTNLARHGLPVVATFGLLAPTMTFWSASGMENSLYLVFLLSAVFLWTPAAGRSQAARLSGVLILGALLTLTRPEAPLVAAAALVLLALFDRGYLATAIATLGGIAAAVALRLALGLDIFPNPVYAKQGDTALLKSLAAGAEYLMRTAIYVPLSTALSVPALVFALSRLLRGQVAPDARPIIANALALALAIWAFVLTAGGDWMYGGRFFAVSHALIFLAALLALPRARLILAAGVLVAVFAADTWTVATSQAAGDPLFRGNGYNAVNFTPAAIERANRAHARDTEFLDAALPILRADPRERLVIASSQAGMVAYYLERELGAKVHFVDLVGLVTDDVLDCRGGDGFRFRPYEDLEGLQTCVGRRFDYIFDLGHKFYQAKTVAAGCEVLVTTEFASRESRFKRRAYGSEFLSRCD